MFHYKIQRLVYVFDVQILTPKRSIYFSFKMRSAIADNGLGYDFVAAIPSGNCRTEIEPIKSNNFQVSRMQL